MQFQSAPIVILSLFGLVHANGQMPHLPTFVQIPASVCTDTKLQISLNWTGLYYPRAANPVLNQQCAYVAPSANSFLPELYSTNFILAAGPSYTDISTTIPFIKILTLLNGDAFVPTTIKAADKELIINTIKVSPERYPGWSVSQSCVRAAIHVLTRIATPDNYLAPNVYWSAYPLDLCTCDTPKNGVNGIKIKFNGTDFTITSSAVKPSSGFIAIAAISALVALF
jgi:hypothetical protein